MPYIPRLERNESLPLTVGQLNYQITKMVVKFLENNHNYTEFNAAIGTLECAKLELYRRMVVPYEDKKCELNGDVY